MVKLIDRSKQRDAMVTRQIAGRGIRDPHVLVKLDWQHKWLQESTGPL